MGFFRRLFGGGDGGSKEPVDTAWHFYVKSKYGDEIIDVRVDPNADLSPEFDGPGDGASHYTTNKDIIGAKSFRTINLYPGVRCGSGLYRRLHHRGRRVGGSGRL